MYSEHVVKTDGSHYSLVSEHWEQSCHLLLGGLLLQPGAMWEPSEPSSL